MLKYLVREPKSATDNPSLIVLIHGYGSNEMDLFGFAEELPDDAYVLSIRGTHETPYGGYCWYELGFSGGARTKDEEQAREAQQQIFDFIEEAQDRFFFDPNNVSLIGFSQGAILSFSLALHHPNTFKKVVCLSGYPDPELLKDADISKDFSNLEFFFSHGTEDTVIPIEWGRQFKSIAEELALDFESHEYNSGHNLSSTNYYDMLNFLN